MLERQTFTLRPQPILEIWHARKIRVRQQRPGVTGDRPLEITDPQGRTKTTHIGAWFRLEAERIDHSSEVDPERRATQTPQLLT